MPSLRNSMRRGSLGGRGFAAFAGLVLAAVLHAAPAFAGSYTFTDTTRFLDHATDESDDLVSNGGTFVNKVEGFGDWVTWAHRFTFEPPAQEVLAGTLVLALRDDKDGCFQSEWGLLLAEDGTLAFGEVNTARYGFDLDAAYLADGTFRVMLASLGGDFYIDQSDLTVTYNAVPLPAAGGLLASGLVMLAGWRRRKACRR